MGHAFVIESAIFTKGESLTAKMLRLDHKHLFRIFYKLTYGRSYSIFMHMAFDFVSSVTKTISNCNFFLLSPFEMILPDVILSFLFKTKQKHTPDA